MQIILFYSITPLVIAGLLIPLLRNRQYIKMKGIIGAAALVITLGIWAYEYFSGAISSWLISSSPVSDLARYFLPDWLSLLVAVVAVMGGLLALPLARRLTGNQTVYISIVLVGVGGTIVLASTLNPFLIVASWGLVSVASYALASIAKDRDSLINSVKYAIMGAIAFQFLVIAVFLIYSSIGNPSGALLLDLGLLLLMAAIGFKIGIPPFHMWLPDLYGYSEPLSVAPLSAIMKLGPIALLLRLMLAQAPSGPEMGALLAVLAVLSIVAMTFGNVTALVQKNIQRMMAYSSMAQVGYMLMAITVAFASFSTRDYTSFYFSVGGLLIYLLAYSASKAGIFTLIKGVRSGREVTLTDIRGLSTTNGAQSASFTILLLNLIGLPPLVGFWGKLLIFASAANPELSFFYIGGVPWFALIGIINSVISVFYYMKIVRSMYGDSEKVPGHDAPVRRFEGLNWVIFASTIIVVVVGIIVPVLLVI